MKDRSSLYLIVLLALGLAAVVVLMLAAGYLGELNQDEGWYLYSARLVSQGKLPFVDFASTQGPVMSYVYALGTPLVERWGLAGGRIFSAILGLICSLCCGLLGCRLMRLKEAGSTAESVAGLTAFLLTGVNVYQCYFTAIVKTYSLTALLLVLGFLALCSACQGSVSCRRARFAGGYAFLAGVLMGLAACTRVSAGAVLPVVFLCLLVMRIKERRLKQDGVVRAWVWFGLGAVITCCAVFWPFVVKSFGAVWFGLVEYHAGRTCENNMQAIMFKAGSVARLIGSYFTAFAVLVCVLTIKVLGWQGDEKKAGRGSRVFGGLILMLWLAAGIVALVHLAAPFPYDEYQVMIYPLFAVGVSVLAAGMMKKKEQLMMLATVVFVLSMGSAVSSPLAHSWIVRDIDRIWPRVNGEPPLVKLQKAGRLLNEVSKPGGMLLTQDTYLAIESGLTLPAGLELGPFSYFPDWDNAKAERCHVLNREKMLLLLGTCEAPVAAFSGYGLAIRSPEVMELDVQEQKMLWETLLKRYSFFRAMDDFGQARTKLRVFLRSDD